MTPERSAWIQRVGAFNYEVELTDEDGYRPHRLRRFFLSTAMLTAWRWKHGLWWHTRKEWYV